MTLGQGIEMGPFHFTIIRLLAAVGLVRVIIRGERFEGKMNGLDWLMLVWAGWAVLSSVFHNFPSEALVYRLGLVYNTCGIYFLLRIFCQSLDDAVMLCRITAFLLVPIAVEMVMEQISGNNLFAVFGGVSEFSQIREGRIRSQGPFAHPILAGTVGAVCLPLMIGMWRLYRKEALMGIATCCTIVFTSASSGPLMSSVAGIGALMMWHYRHQMRIVRWLAVFCYIGLDLIMKAPAYYLLGRIDLTGGSTGYHRAALIEAAIRHLNEWWLAGTDYTRHWMPTGVSWSPDHTDITNHYLGMGVLGGVPLMFLFIVVLAKGFFFVGRTLRHATDLQPQYHFMTWALGASLFAHAATFISVSYFDQSFVFIYLTLAAISSAKSGEITASASSMSINEASSQIILAKGKFKESTE